MPILKILPHDYDEPDHRPQPFLCAVIMPMTIERIGRDIPKADERPSVVDSVKKAFEIFRPEVDLRICLAGGGIEFTVRAEFRDLEDFDPEGIEERRERGPGRNDVAALKEALTLLRDMRALYEQPSVRELWNRVAESADQAVTDANREIREVTEQCREKPASGIEFVARMTDLDRLEYTWKDALAKIDARIEALERLRGELLAAIFERMRPIEVSYRQVGLFFENAVSPDDVSGRRVELAILNADPAVMADESKGLDEIEEFIADRNDSFNFHRTAAAVAAPGVISDAVRRRLSRTAARWGAVFLTDGASGLSVRASHSFEKYWHDGGRMQCPASLVFAGCLARAGSDGAVFYSGPQKGVACPEAGRTLVNAFINNFETQRFTSVPDADGIRFERYEWDGGSGDYSEMMLSTSYRIAHFVDDRTTLLLRDVSGCTLDRWVLDDRVEQPLTRLLAEMVEDGTLHAWRLWIDRSPQKLSQGIFDSETLIWPVGSREAWMLWNVAPRP